MTPIKPIRIHALDSQDAAYDRHAEIEKRLEELGKAQVGLMVASGGFPTEWNTIIHAWLGGKKLEQRPEDDPGRPVPAHGSGP